MVFLVSAISMLPSGAMAPRNACGSTTWRSVWLKVRPIERAASAWPVRHGVDAAAQRLAHERRVVDRQAEDGQAEVVVDQEGRRVLVGQAKAEVDEQADVAEHDDQRQRGVAEDVDVARAERTAGSGTGRDPHDGHDGADHAASRWPTGRSGGSSSRRPRGCRIAVNSSAIGCLSIGWTPGTPPARGERAAYRRGVGQEQASGVGGLPAPGLKPAGPRFVVRRPSATSRRRSSS